VTDHLPLRMPSSGADQKAEWAFLW
jgi:hypothetical protein